MHNTKIIPLLFIGIVVIFLWVWSLSLGSNRYVLGASTTSGAPQQLYIPK